MRLASVVMKGIVDDKTTGERLLKRSDVDWTIVYRTVEGPPTEVGSISRADVASALLAALDDPDAVQRDFVVTSPRADATAKTGYVAGSAAWRSMTPSSAEATAASIDRRSKLPW